MDDLAGLGKLADSKLVNKAYDDVGSPAVKEMGKLAEDLTKTLRLFTAPFQLAALAQDRFALWLDEARSRVPLERQVESPAHIAGPALRAMLFMEDDNPLSKLFVNLLSQTIDKETCGNVHPSFVHILEQICPDEAQLLYKMSGTWIVGASRARVTLRKDKSISIEALTNFPTENFVFPNKIPMYLEHLEIFGIVEDSENVEVEVPEDRPEWKKFRWYNLTEFGSQFLKVCVQDTLSHMNKSGQSNSE